MSYSQKRTGRSRADSKNGGGGGNPSDSDNPGRGSDNTFATSGRNHSGGVSDPKFPSSLEHQSSIGSTTRDYMINSTVPTRDGGSQISAATATAIASQINHPSHKNTLSECTLTPLRRRSMARHNRSLSIISAHTDFEICAVADLLAPSVSHTRSYAEEQERIGVAVDDCDEYLDPSNTVGKILVTPYLLLEHEEPLSPSFGSHFPTSSSTASESEFDISSDEHYNPYTPSTSAYAFHLPRRTRTRSRASNGHISASDSDTPSLSSSTTSFSSQSYSTSPPVSPDTLKTPIDHPAPSQYLTIIEERAAEDQGFGGRRRSRGSGSNFFPSVHERSPSPRKPFVARTPEPRPKGRVFNVDHLRLNVPPQPAHQFPSLSSPSTCDITPPLSSTLSPSSPYPSSPYTRAPTTSFSHFVPGGMKGSKTTLESGWSTSPTASVITSRTARKVESKEEKAWKAEEKKRRKAETKAESKAKMERLAEELKERKRRHAATFDRQSVHSHRSYGRPPRRQWDTDVAMYNGLSAL